MRIALVSQPRDLVVPPVERGSIAIILYQLARRLARRHEVTIFARQAPGQPRVQVDADGVTIRTLRVASKPWQFLDIVDGLAGRRHPLFASPLYYFPYALKVARAARRLGADIVHVPSFAQYAPILRAIHPAARIVLHMQGESLGQLDRSRIERQLRDADLVLGCSDYITGIGRSRFPALADRFRTLPNGVDTDHFIGAVAANGATMPGSVGSPGAGGPDPKARRRAGPSGGRGQPERLLFVGRVSPEKGVHVLMEAFADVAAARPEARLDIVGGVGMLPFAYHVALSHDEKVAELRRYYGRGPGEKVHRQLLRRQTSYIAELRRTLPRSLAGRVSFHGALPHPALVHLYQAADVFVFPSVWHEAFGLPIVEAMACRLPVVATRSGGIPEIVADGETGLLVERGEAGQLAAALLDILETDERRRAMGEAGRRRAHALFSWDVVADRLGIEYERLVSVQGPGRSLAS